MPFFGVPIRNGLPIGLGSVAGFGVQQFDPSLLFAGGTVPGAWYDPSDLTTMFTTSAGTTPVAMPGQGSAVSVGLMLDKSQGLVLGSELVTNGDFSSGGTGWTAGAAGVTFTGGEAVYVSVTSTFTVRQSGVITAEKTYEVQFEITAYTSGTIQAKLNGTVSALGLSRSAAGIYREYITSTSTADGILAFQVSGFTGSIDNISVRELPGNHAIAINNTTARPELRARVNLLTYSEEFDNGAWVKSASTITANATTAPDGTTTADRLIDNATNNFHGTYQGNSQSGIVTASIYVKYVNKQFVSFLTNNNGVSDRYAYFDLVNKTTHNVNAGFTASIVDAGGGWLRLIVTSTSVGGSSWYYWWNIAASTSATAYLGNGTGAIDLWGADLRPANIGANVPAYQRIADANTYDTNGFPLYLRFDGIDDGMYTPANLNLAATDKVGAFAGVRQVAAGNQQLVEFSADVNANNGAFSMPKDAVAPAVWTAGLRGTTATSASSSAIYAAPITTVNTGLYDIALSADEVKLRINGAQVATSGAGSAGTGNFGTYPLYIGSRNNSSVWFNGHLHGLIVVGSAVSAGNISATESWMAGKTGLVLP